MVAERRTPDMLVVLDSDPNSLAALTIAQRYSSGTVLLTSWSADPLEIDAVVQSSTTAEPTISEALQVAAQRGMPWVGVRRDFAAPPQLLTELMIATARHSRDVIPGFAVFLADGDPAPFSRILAIVDRSDGPISGLLAYAAVAVADTAGAQLDILVIGDAGENPHSEDELETLVINREQELYDAAVARARAEDLAVTWITAASVKDLWRVVADQISQHDYDLVIDDLGDVSLSRMGMKDSAGETLEEGAAGEIPLKLLTETSIPLLLVMDEIRLGLAPPGLLKAGAVAAIALGMVAAPIAAAAAAQAPATASTDRPPDPVDALITDLEPPWGPLPGTTRRPRRIAGGPPPPVAAPVTRGLAARPSRSWLSPRHTHHRPLPCPRARTEAAATADAQIQVGGQGDLGPQGKPQATEAPQGRGHPQPGGRRPRPRLPRTRPPTRRTRPRSRRPRTRRPRPRPSSWPTRRQLQLLWRISRQPRRLTPRPLASPRRPSRQQAGWRPCCPGPPPTSR